MSMPLIHPVQDLSSLTYNNKLVRNYGSCDINTLAYVGSAHTYVHKKGLASALFFEA